MRILLLSLMLVTPALARIGETPAQCVARYGEPTVVLKEEMVTYHEKAGLEIRCEFIEGRCEQIEFRSLEKDSKGNRPLRLSEKQILLEASSGGKPWVQSQATERGSIWKCGELMAAAIETENCFLVIYTKLHEEYRDNPDKAAKSKLKEF